MALLIKRFCQPLQMSIVAISTRKCSNVTSRTYQKKAFNTLGGTFRHHFAHLDRKDLVILRYKVPKMRDLDLKQVDKLCHSLKRFGFTWEDILENPKIMYIPSHNLIYRMQLLEEFGFDNPGLKDLIFIKAHMYSEISFLKFHGAISESTNVLQHLWESIKQLELPKTVLKEAEQRYPEIESTTLGELYIHFLKHYLSRRFSVEVEKVEGFLHQIWNKAGPESGPSQQLSFKALGSYPSICDTHLNNLHYDFTHISTHTSLLSIDPSSVEKVLTEFPTIGGISIYEVALEFPEFLLIPAKNVQQWISLLEKYNVKTFQVTTATLNLFFTGNYKEAEERLSVLSRQPDWEMICYSEKFFSLLRQRRPFGMKRIIEASASDQPMRSVNATIMPGKTIKRTIRPPEEIIYYISQELDLKEEEAKKLMNSNKYEAFGLTNTNMVLRKLKNYGFSREQIMNGMEIISFEFSDVKKVLNDLSKNPEAQPISEWMESPYVIHLLMYLIKKNVLYS